MKRMLVCAVVLAAWGGEAADCCTFDFREASRLHFEKEDPLAPNVVKSTVGFRRARMQRWDTRWSKDVPVEDDKLDALAVAEAQDGYWSMLSPETMIPVAGGKEKAALLHNFAEQFVDFPDDEGGDYRISFRYRGNHEYGSSCNGAYAILIDGETGDRRIGAFNMPDTGPDSDYWNSRERIFRLKKGHPKRCRLEIRLDGIAYLKINNLKIAKVRASERPPVEMKCIPYGDIDETVAVESGDVGHLVLAWRATREAKFDARRDGAEVVLPRGFELVGANVKPTEANPLAVEPQADGTTRVRLPMCGRIAPERGNRWHAAWALSLLVRATGPVGTEGVATFRAVRADGSPLGTGGRVTLKAVAPIACTMPRRFFTGTMMHYDIENFRWGEKANEAYADYLRRHGSNWIIPQVSHMLENDGLIGIWKRAGFAHITPQWHDYIANGYLIGNERTRPEADRYKPPHGEKDYGFPGAACPAATYEERPFFLTNVIVKIENATKGCDGMWHNWELHPYLGGCWCDRCMDKLKDWKDTVPHFQSDQHGKLCETLARHYKRIYGKDAPGFMPAISWADFCSAMMAVDYQKAKRPQDYFRFLDWIPAWGPYHGWEANGPYNPQRGRSVWIHLAMADSKASLAKICAGGKIPKLIAQPAGPNWLIQPEWLEIQMEAAFFQGWQACIPWIFPYGCDARHFGAFCRAATMAAKYEDVVFDGVRNDAATAVRPKPGFARTCFKPDGTFMPEVRDVPLLQQITYDHKGVRSVAVFNYDDESHCEFTLRTKGLSGSSRVFDENGNALFGGKSFTGAELAETGVELSVDVSRCAVFEFRRP